MFALTCKQPFASAIVLGKKSHEFRPWEPEIRPPFRIAIHAAKSIPLKPEFAGLTHDDMHEMGYSHPDQLPTGALVGTVDVVRFGKATEESQWGKCVWEYANPRPCRPYPIKGQLGLWPLPDHLELVEGAVVSSDAEIRPTIEVPPVAPPPPPICPDTRERSRLGGPTVKNSIRLALFVTGADGEEKLYRLRIVAGGGECGRAWELTNISDDVVYLVRCTDLGHWTCDCKDFFFRGRRDANHKCKHIRAIIASAERFALPLPSCQMV
jgi:hypothetical protein